MKKRISRHERYVITERAKTAAIVVLCLCCVMFSYRLIKLQNISGSTFFVGGTVGGAVTENAAQNAVKAYSAYSAPELIVINRQGSHFALADSGTEYTRVYEAAAAMMRSAYGLGAETALANDTAWRLALTSDSVYIRYPCVRSAEFEAQFHETKSAELAESIPAYSEVILIPSAEDGASSVLMRGDGGAVSIKCQGAFGTMKELIEGYGGDGMPYMFGFEMKNSDETAANAAYVEPLLAIPTGTETAANIVVNVPWEYENGIGFTKTTDLTLGLINTFGYNQNTIRRYVDRDGALVCVGETGTLSMRPDGTIEYKALDISEGVSLLPSGQGGSGNTYAVTSGLIGIIERIFGLCGESTDMREYKVRFTQMPQNVSEDKMVFCLDYFVDGRIIGMQGGHAVEATVSRGMLTEMKMCVKTVEKSETQTEIRPAAEMAAEACTARGDGACASGASVVYSFLEDGVEIAAEREIKIGREVRQ